MCHDFLIIEDLLSHSDTLVSRTPLDRRSALHGGLYQTTYNIHKTETSIPQAGFEPIIPASERPQTHALDRATTGIGHTRCLSI
jgi:hypothetical protein